MLMVQFIIVPLVVLRLEVSLEKLVLSGILVQEISVSMAPIIIVMLLLVLIQFLWGQTMEDTLLGQGTQ